MICPKCRSKNLTILATEWSDHRPVQHPVDVDGHTHVHDPKTFRRTYRCPRGHEFTRSGRVRCPYGDYPKPGARISVARSPLRTRKAAKSTPAFRS